MEADPRRRAACEAPCSAGEFDGEVVTVLKPEYPRILSVGVDEEQTRNLGMEGDE